MIILLVISSYTFYYLKSSTKNTELQGKVMINNQEYTAQDFSKFAGYVM